VEQVRVDRWLAAARIFKSRTQAHEACVGGHVKRNGDSLKPHHLVRAGDRLDVLAPQGMRLLEVVGVAEKRLSPPLARELYVDHTPPPPERIDNSGREPGTGRPTKRERRLLGRLRGR
jgi:ribosome-associated heat shock protein Hsp15